MSQLLNYFTFIPISEIEGIMDANLIDSSNQVPQRILAREVTELVHGKSKALKAVTKSKVLFDESLTEVTTAQILNAFDGDDRLVTLDKSLQSDIISLTIASGLLPSKSIE